MGLFSTAFDGLRPTASRVSRGRNRGIKGPANRPVHSCGLRLELLEERALLSVALGPTFSRPFPRSLGRGSRPQGSSGRSCRRSRTMASALASNPVTHSAPYAPVTVQQGTANNVSSFSAIGELADQLRPAKRRRGRLRDAGQESGELGNLLDIRHLRILGKLDFDGWRRQRTISRNAIWTYRHGFDWGPNDGGNTSMSEAYLGRFSGPISESADPYSNMGTPDSITGPVQDYVREMLRFDSDSEIKKRADDLWRRGYVDVLDRQFLPFLGLHLLLRRLVGHESRCDDRRLGRRQSYRRGRRSMAYQEQLGNRLGQRRILLAGIRG